MARKREKNRPIERLRSTWTSTADLEETIAAMFQRSAESSSRPLPTPYKSFTQEDFRPPVATSLGPTDTVAALSRATVSDGAVATVTDKSAETVTVAPSDTVSAGSADTVAPERRLTPAANDPAATVSVEPTVAAAPMDTVAGGATATVSANHPLAGLWQAEVTGGVFPASRVRRIAIAQDALTHSEESVYDTLWGPKNQNRDTYRLVSLGYDAVAKSARVTKMNAKWIIERLIQKGFVKVEVLPDPLRRIPTRYRVYSYRAALDNMAQSNRFYVVRTGNGVLFAHPFDQTTTVVAGSADTVVGGAESTVARRPAATVSRRQAETVSPGQEATVVAADTRLGSISETPMPSNVVAAAIIGEMGFVDDDALRTLLRKCRENASDATDEEIAELGAMTARRIVRMRNVENPTGLLIEQTAKCFVGEPFAIYRRDREEREARIRELYGE